MDLSYQLYDFISYIIIGSIMCILLDIFRAYRKYKKVGRNIIILQDIVYFILLIVIVIFANVFLLHSQIRFYLVIGICMGIFCYYVLISKFIINIYINIFKMNKVLINFIFMPITLIRQVIRQNNKIIGKITFFYCNKIKNVINYIIIRVKSLEFFKISKSKRVENEKNK